MKTVAEKEGLDPDVIRQRTAAGTIAIPCNINHRSISPEGIGQGLRTKINVNLGISGDCPDYSREMEKVKLSIEYGAESIMDLSNYGKTHDFRQALIDVSPAMIGTVPMYDAVGYLDNPTGRYHCCGISRCSEGSCAGRSGLYDDSRRNQSQSCRGI